jgi:hypothetical protein
MHRFPFFGACETNKKGHQSCQSMAVAGVPCFVVCSYAEWIVTLLTLLVNTLYSPVSYGYLLLLFLVVRFLVGAGNRTCYLCSFSVIARSPGCIGTTWRSYSMSCHSDTDPEPKSKGKGKNLTLYPPPRLPRPSAEGLAMTRVDGCKTAFFLAQGYCR